jgi:hypothetical protein
LAFTLTAPIVKIPAVGAIIAGSNETILDSILAVSTGTASDDAGEGGNSFSAVVDLCFVALI